MGFDWLRSGLLFEKDGGAGDGNPDDSAEDEAKKKAAESDAGDDTDTKAEKKFSQADLDRIVKERLDREKKKSDEAAAKAKKDAEDAALAKNQEWEKLATQRQTEIDDIKKTVAELEPFKEQAEKYKTALNAQLTEIKKSLPKFVLQLIDKMDPVDAMKYITDNADELGAKPETFSATPRHKEKKVKDEDAKAAEQASSSIISQGF